ncbi:hypothetical protein [Kitasatospora sp. NPDC057541]
MTGKTNGRGPDRTGSVPGPGRAPGAERGATAPDQGRNGQL